MRKQIFTTIESLLFCALLITACKKEKDTPSVKNWESELMATAWSGEFQLNSGGANQTVQPFTLLLNADHTVTWFDISGEQPGVWSVRESTVSLNFTNGKILTATVSKDNWSNFTNVTVNGWQVINLIKTVIPKPEELLNSVWKVKFTGGSEVIITFLPQNKLKYSIANIPTETSYTIKGAGIKFSNFAFAVNSSEAYFILQNNSVKGFTIVSDFAATYYSSCSGTRQ